MESTELMEVEQPNQTEENKRLSRQKRKEEKKETGFFRRLSQRMKQIHIRRIFPIWLRLLVIFFLAIAALILGLIIGYTVIGDGEGIEVLTFDAWKHVIDIIKGVE